MVIFVVFDRLSIYVFFVPLSHPITSLHVAQAYLYKRSSNYMGGLEVLWVTEILYSWVAFGKLFSLHDTQFLISSAYHPKRMYKQKLSIGALRPIWEVCVEIVPWIGVFGYL